METTLLLSIIAFAFVTTAGWENVAEPSFAEPIKNITVPVNQRATLTCIVDNLGILRTAWMKADTQTLLVVYKHVITHNSRFSTSHIGMRVWNLHIDSVKEEDRGEYLCLINTSPIQSQVGYIDVQRLCSRDEQHACQTDTKGNECVPSAGDYHCICNATRFESNGIRQCRHTFAGHDKTMLRNIIPNHEINSDSSLSATKASTRCGDWHPYKDQKCLKIATQAGHQTKEEAEGVCQAFSEGLTKDSYPRLMTVKTNEEEAFLQHFLFHENNIVNNVWLGLQKIGNSEEFEWSDGTNVVYSNWANQNTTYDRHQCVQMATGDGLAAAGLWVRVTCKKVGVIVCERTQTWSLEVLQSMVLNLKLEQAQLLSEKERQFTAEITLLKQKNEAADKEIDRMKKEVDNLKQETDNLKQETDNLKQETDNLKQETDNLKQETDNLKQETDTLKRNPIPLGFVYVQLPNQQPPSSLWPQTTWTDVSSLYAGLFFRVVGGGAALFGQVQEANMSRLQQIQYSTSGNTKNPVTIPADGSWSDYVYCGPGTGDKHHAHRFRLSGEEMRPRNQAVKVWQRSS